MPEINLQTRLIRAPDLIVSEMDGDLVMMHINSSSYFGISGVGVRIWEQLQQPKSLAELAQAIEQAYDVDQQTCQADLLAFAEKMLANGIAQRCD
jgi:hypothetical protein